MIRATLITIGGVGQVELSISAFAQSPMANARCGYLVELDGGVVTASYPQSLQGQCPKSVGFSLERVSNSQLALKLSPTSIEEFQEPQAMILTGNRRPLLESELAVPVVNLDILGIAPGMDRPMVEAKLDELGFVPVGEPHIRYAQDATRETIVWGRQPNEDGRRRIGGFGDTISITFTASGARSSQPATVAFVSRNWWPTEGDNYPVESVRQSLTDKHGPEYQNGKRMYRRDGQIADLTFALNCVYDVAYPSFQAPHFEGGVGASFRYEQRTHDISIACGPTANTHAKANSSGMLEQLTALIFNPDIIWQDMWSDWAYQNYVRLSDQIDTAKSATGAAPEL